MRRRCGTGILIAGCRVICVTAAVAILLHLISSIARTMWH